MHLFIRRELGAEVQTGMLGANGRMMTWPPLLPLWKRMGQLANQSGRMQHSHECKEVVVWFISFHDGIIMYVSVIFLKDTLQ